MCIWHPAADSLRYDSKALDLVFRNKRVETYLDSYNMLGIAGIKGQGKTFLIKAKRRALQKQGSVLLLPKDSVMIDALDNDLRIKSNQRKFLSSYTNWVAVWKVAIILTIVQYPSIKDKIDDSVLKSLSKDTTDLLTMRNDDFRPSVFVYSLIKMNNKSINTVFSDLPILLQAVSYIHSPVAIFFDKADQAFSHDVYKIIGDSQSAVGTRNASIWQFCQLALANAASDLYSSSNQHIKVFYTIRQEALVDAEQIAPNVFRNFNSFIVTLEYSKKDLFDMFVLYISNESDNNLKKPELKGTRPEEAFAGFDIIEHGYVKSERQCKERLFDYIYRHTMSRPYDIQQICWDLCMSNISNLDIDGFRHIVNSSSRKIAKQYIAEMDPFTVQSRTSIYELLSNITTNVFDISYMKNICNRYMLSRENKESCKMNCKDCDAIYPFSNLYNIGLLGYLYNNQSCETMYEQRFVSATDRIITGNTVRIDPSELYFLHPCLSDIARDKRRTLRREFSNTNKIIIGNNLSCSGDELEQIKDDLKVYKKKLYEESVFISSTMINMKDERLRAAKALLDKGYFPVYCESPEYKIDTHTFSHDSCIDEMLRCGNVLSIFGTEYGGEYAGEKYKSYEREIIEKSKNRIEKPSITLMEYYVARKKGKKLFVLMSNKITDYYGSESHKSRKSLEWERKDGLDKVSIILDFINKLRNSDDQGNMIKFYSNINDIALCISDHEFK